MTSNIKSRRWRDGGGAHGVVEGSDASEVCDPPPQHIQANANWVRLAPGIGLKDLTVEPSSCGQCLMLIYDRDVVALISCMGGDVDTIEFADNRRYSVEELVSLIGGAV